MPSPPPGPGQPALRFFERPFPNANAVLLDDVLIDPGTPGDAAALLGWLGGVRPSLVVNTHWHSDHSGMNAAFQAQGVPIALPAEEAAQVNAGDPDACRARWLNQHVPTFRADRGLIAGDDVAGWRVVVLPGHSATQLGLLHDDMLISADALMDADIGWLDLDADPRALAQAEATVAWIAAQGLRLVLPGHGPAITDVPAAVARAQRRLASWRADPARIGWHACKRIFTHELLTSGGLRREAVAPYLLGSLWFLDHARRAFGTPPAVFADALVAEMVRARAGVWVGEWLRPAVPTP